MPYAGTLTPDQLERVAEVRDQWMTTALSTERCDRPRAEAAVRAAYTAADLPVPPLMIWMDSPVGGVFAKAVLRQSVRPG